MVILGILENAKFFTFLKSFGNLYLKQKCKYSMWTYQRVYVKGQRREKVFSLSCLAIHEQKLIMIWYRLHTSQSKQLQLTYFQTFCPLSSFHDRTYNFQVGVEIMTYCYEVGSASFYLLRPVWRSTCCLIRRRHYRSSVADEKYYFNHDAIVHRNATNKRNKTISVFTIRSLTKLCKGNVHWNECMNKARLHTA